MSRKTAHPNCYIIAGSNGTGKTAFASAFLPIYADRRNFINPDLLARAYARAGFVPFLDFPVVSHAHRLQAYRRALRRLDFYLVVLNPGRAVALQRDAVRPEKTVAHLWVHMEDALLRELAGFGLWIDTAHLSVQQTIDQILSQKERALLDNATP